MAYNNDEVREEDVGLGPLTSADEDGEDDDEPLPAAPESEEDYE